MPIPTKYKIRSFIYRHKIYNAYIFIKEWKAYIDWKWIQIWNKIHPPKNEFHNHLNINTKYIYIWLPKKHRKKYLEDLEYRRNKIHRKGTI